MEDDSNSIVYHNDNDNFFFFVKVHQVVMTIKGHSVFLR